MPVLLQICAVIVTLALAAIAIVTVRTMMRFEKAADELSVTAIAIRSSLGQIEGIVAEVRDVVESIREVVPHLQRTVARIEGIGERAAGIADAVLGEIEAPVRVALGVSRGVRSGAGHLVERLTHGLRGKFLSWWEGSAPRSESATQPPVEREPGGFRSSDESTPLGP